MKTTTYTNLAKSQKCSLSQFIYIFFYSVLITSLIQSCTLPHAYCLSSFLNRVSKEQFENNIIQLKQFGDLTWMAFDNYNSSLIAFRCSTLSSKNRWIEKFYAGSDCMGGNYYVWNSHIWEDAVSLSQNTMDEQSFTGTKYWFSKPISY